MGAEPWVFGEQPLGEVVELAGLIRDVAGLALALERPSPALLRLVAGLREARDALGKEAPTDLAPRVGPAPGRHQRVYLDHSRDVGRYNPCVPEYQLSCADGEAHGTVSFPLVFEGPPGVVHGGAVALFFDCALQQLNCDLGQSGRTTGLVLRYRRPTPLLVPLEVRASRTVGGDRIECSGELRLDGEVLCTAEMRAVAGDRSRLPAVSPRRDA